MRYSTFVLGTTLSFVSLFTLASRDLAAAPATIVEFRYKSGAAVSQACEDKGNPVLASQSNAGRGYGHCQR